MLYFYRRKNRNRRQLYLNSNFAARTLFPNFLAKMAGAANVMQSGKLKYFKPEANPGPWKLVLELGLGMNKWRIRERIPNFGLQVCSEKLAWKELSKSSTALIFPPISPAEFSEEEDEKLFLFWHNVVALLLEIKSFFAAASAFPSCFFARITKSSLRLSQ